MDTRPHQTSRFRAQLFGPFQIYRDGMPLGARGAPCLSAARTLLKWFLLHPGRSWSASELAAACSPSTGPPRLHRTLHALRDYLESQRGRGGSSFIRRQCGGYAFHPSGRWEVDVWQADASVAAATRARDRGDPELAIGILEDLKQVNARTFLPEDLYDPTFADVRRDVDATGLHADRLLLGLYVEAGHLSRALAHGLEMFQAAPYDEYAVHALAQAHLRGGNRIAGLRLLIDFSERLQAELGVSPAPELVELQDLLRRCPTQ